MESLLSEADITIDKSSYVDPNGFLFHSKNRLFRAITVSKTQFYELLFDDGVINECIKNYGLIETVKSDEFKKIDADSLIFEHRKIERVSFCSEWSFSMLKDAALLHIDLAIQLNKHGLMLQDAYPWNVLFDYSDIKFVDLTSIVVNEKYLIWPAYQQFLSYFFWPLKLYAQGLGYQARLMLADNIAGIDFKNYYSLLKISSKIKPDMFIRNILEKSVSTNSKSKSKFNEFLASKKIDISAQTRDRFFKKLRTKIEKIKVNSKDNWTNYYQDLMKVHNHDKKLQSVEQCLLEFNPQTVVDLGANNGRFSILAAKCGARVTALDSSEACIEYLYSYAKANKLNILPLVVDLLCPLSNQGFLSEQYLPIHDRVHSDLALCLGIMHHMYVKGRQSVERIVKLIHFYSQKAVIFEFIANNDENIGLISTRRDINYTIEQFESEFRRYYLNVKTLPSDRETRKIIFAFN